MGKLAQAAQGRTLQKANPTSDFKSILKSQWGKIQTVLPSTMNPNRFFQLAVSTYNSDPKLADCSTISVLSCLMKCAALGMEPSAVDGLGRAYILPFFNKKTGGFEATFILGYKGMIDLARRSGEIKSISARAVYKDDEFSYAYGLDEYLRHIPNHQVKREDKDLMYTYCIAQFKDGGHYFVVLSREEIEAARKASKASNRGPWVTNYAAMAVKTAIRRAFPYLPVSVVAQEAAATDDQTPDYSSVLQPSFAVESTVEPEPSVPDPLRVQVNPETGEVTEAPDEPPIELADEDIAFGEDAAE